MGNIIHITYNYFELEGIPSYPSSFIPIDYLYDWWIDKDNPNRFRFEKHFTPRTAPARAGLMVITTSTGSEAKILHTEIWDNEPITTENDQPISNSSYTDWYETFTAMGRRLEGEIKQKPPSHTYMGEQIDEKWGSLHIFQKNEIVQASDVLSGLPLIITYKIHSTDFRWIEMIQKVQKKEQEINFRLWRLAAWDELEANKLPIDIFDHTFMDENYHGYQ